MITHGQNIAAQKNHKFQHDVMKTPMINDLSNSLLGIIIIIIIIIITISMIFQTHCWGSRGAIVSLSLSLSLVLQIFF